MGSKKRWLIGCGSLGLLLFSVLLFMIAFYFGNDDSPYDDRDLLISQSPIIRDADNASVFYRRAQLVGFDEATQEKVKQMLAGQRPWDTQFVEDLWRQNQSAMALFEEGLKRTQFDYPQERIPHIQQYSDLAQLRLAHLRSLIQHQHEEQALSEAFQLLRFSKQLNRGHLMGLGVAGVTKLLTMAELSTLFQQTRLSSEQIKPYIAKLQAFEDDGIEFSNVMKTDYVEKWQNVEKVLQGTKLGPFYYFGFHRHATKKLLAEHYRALIRNAQAPYWQHQSALLAKVDSSPLKPNFFGRYLLNTIANPGGADISVTCIHYPNAKLRVLETYIALKAYQQAHSRLPESLQALVPEILPSVPIDPFDGKPLKYDLKNRTLYSVSKADDLTLKRVEITF